MRIALIAAALLAMAGPALAQPTPPTDVSPVVVDKPVAEAPIKPGKKGSMDDPNRVVCQREHVVGSNRPQKVCMTVAERQRLKDQADLLTDPGRRTSDTEQNIREEQARNGG